MLTHGKQRKTVTTRRWQNGPNSLISRKRFQNYWDTINHKTCKKKITNENFISQKRNLKRNLKIF